MTVTDRTDATDAEFRSRIAPIEAAPTPPEVREARVVEEVARALAACHLSGKPYKPQPSGPPRVDWAEFAAAAVAAYRSAQDGGDEEAVRRVDHEGLPWTEARARRAAGL